MYFHIKMLLNKSAYIPVCVYNNLHILISVYFSRSALSFILFKQNKKKRKAKSIAYVISQWYYINISVFLWRYLATLDFLRSVSIVVAHKRLC